MTEIERKLLDEYCKANFNYELWKHPEREGELKKYVYYSFAFRRHLLRHTWNEFLDELSKQFPFNLINRFIKKILKALTRC